MTKIQKLQTFLLLFIVYCLLFTIPAKAQTFSLAIYPPLLEVMIMPGKSVTQTYTLTNSGDKTEVNTQIVNFKPADELGNIKLETGNWKLPREAGSRSAGETQSWFSFKNSDIALGEPFLLKTGEKKQIILRVKIPEETAEDDYYFTLLFSTQPAGEFALLGTKQAGVIGTNILITVSKDGQPPKKGEIVEFRLLDCYLVRLLNLCLIDSFQKPQFLLRLKNTGRAFWKPFGKIKTEGLIGQKWEEKLQPDNILASSIRQIQVATESASPSFLVGPYRAKAEFSLDEEGQTLSAAISFLALPFKAIFGLLTMAFLIVTIKSVIKKHLRR